MKRQEFTDGTEVEGAYVRAVRVGPHVYVAGTTATDEQGRVAGPDAATQTLATLAKIKAALERAGAGIDDVVRVVVYCIDLADAPVIIGSLRQHAGSTLPAATLIEVKGLMDAEARLEIQVDAVIAEA